MLVFILINLCILFMLSTFITIMAVLDYNKTRGENIIILMFFIITIASALSIIFQSILISKN